MTFRGGVALYEKCINFSVDNWMLVTVEDTGSAVMLRGCNAAFKFNLTPVTIWRIVGSAVIASHCGKKCLSFPAWKLVCDFTKLCTMSICAGSSHMLSAQRTYRHGKSRNVWGRTFFVNLLASVISFASFDKSPNRYSEVPSTVDRLHKAA